MSSFFDESSLVFIPSGYKTSKAYSVKPTDGSGDLTFTRSNDTATRIGPDGLIEKVRTNYVLQSQAFDNASWDKVLTTISANTTANPLDGAVNADTITLSAGTSQKFIAQVITINGNFTISVYLKAGTHQFAQILLGTDPTPFANFDLVNGTASATGSTASIVSVGNGWYRCSMAFSTSTGNSVFILACDSLGTARFQPTSSTGTLIAFGYQLETGDIATPYIATTTAAVSVGPVANVPRLDYLNSSCPRLLLEPQRTNAAQRSEDFSNAFWTKLNATITANSAVSPDGYANADQITDDATSGQHIAYNTTVSTRSTGSAWSVFMKKGTLDFGFVGCVQSSADYTTAVINLTNGVVKEVQNASSTTGNVTTQDYGNGWYRVILQSTALAGGISVGCSDGSLLTGSIKEPIYSGTGKHIFTWGAQLEDASYATSYIPTLGAAVTRGADAASKTGISSLIGQTEGTLFVEGVFGNEAEEMYLFLQNEASSSVENAIYLQKTSSSILLRVWNASSLDVSIVGGTFAVGQSIKIAAAYKLNDFVLYVNGVQIGTDTSGAVPLCGRLQLGSFYADPTNNIYIARQANQTLLFKTRLSNADLAALTA